MRATVVDTLVGMIVGGLRNQARLLRDRWVLEREAARAGCRIDPRAIVRLGRGAQLRLGRGVVVQACTLLSLEPDPLGAAVQEIVLEVGEGTYFGEFNNVRVAGVVRIGRKCLISQGVSILGANHSIARGAAVVDQPSRTDRIGVTLGDDVWVGANATILPGVKIGSGAVIAAGAVVTRDVAPCAIVAGVPARVVGARQ